MSLFSKLFGGKKKEVSNGDKNVESLAAETLQGIIDLAGFSLKYNIFTENNDRNEPVLTIELSGDDEALLKDKEGQLIESFQLFIKRVIQHNFPEDRTHIVVDCDGFKEERVQSLIDLAEKLKSIALEKGKSVYFRALPPKDRKIIHQHFANDTEIKIRSVGEGQFKKLKIFPVRNNNQNHRDHSAQE